MAADVHGGADFSFAGGLDETAWQPGRLGSDYSIFINGDPRHLITGSLASTNYIGALTVCAWMYQAGNNAWNQYMNKGPSDGSVDTPFMVQTWTFSNPAAMRTGSAGAWSASLLDGVFPTNVWFHYAYSFADGDIGTQAKMYIDGVPQTVNWHRQNFGACEGDTSPIRYGERGDGQNQLRNNYSQDHRIYGVELTDQEIAQIAAGTG